MTNYVMVLVLLAVAGCAPSEPARDELPVYETAYYEDCDAARKAGAAPLHQGEPGYRHRLDPDGDGVAC